MTKIIIILTLAFSLNAKYEAKKVTSSDLEDLNAIDKKLYDLASHRKTYDYEKVANFIYSNLAFKLDYTLLKVEGTASARGTMQDESTNQYTNEGNRARAEIIITYPFYDAKESNERLAKMMTTKQKIITQVKKHFTIKAEHKDLEIEKLILIRIETRVKARKLQAVGSFDEWLEVIRDIRKINNKLTLSEIELSESKQLLLAYVKKNKRHLLKEML